MLARGCLTMEFKQINNFRKSNFTESMTSTRQATPDLRSLLAYDLRRRRPL